MVELAAVRTWRQSIECRLSVPTTTGRWRGNRRRRQVRTAHQRTRDCPIIKSGLNPHNFPTKRQRDGRCRALDRGHSWRKGRCPDDRRHCGLTEEDRMGSTPFIPYRSRMGRPRETELCSARTQVGHRPPSWASTATATARENAAALLKANPRPLVPVSLNTVPMIPGIACFEGRGPECRQAGPCRCQCPSAHLGLGSTLSGVEATPEERPHRPR